MLKGMGLGDRDEAQGHGIRACFQGVGDQCLMISLGTRRWSSSNQLRTTVICASGTELSSVWAPSLIIKNRWSVRGHVLRPRVPRPPNSVIRRHEWHTNCSIPPCHRRWLWKSRRAAPSRCRLDPLRFEMAPALAPSGGGIQVTPSAGCWAPATMPSAMPATRTSRATTGQWACGTRVVSVTTKV